jgi:class 3 adenylate cyclase
MPETRYALTREGVCVAHQVFGDAPRDLVFSPGWLTNLEVLMELPEAVRFFRRLSRTFRVIVFDKQGTGMSDRIGSFPDLDARMDDIDAVMSEVGAERATLLGPTQGGALSSLFAASFPDRVEALVLYGGTARLAWAPDYPWGSTEEDERSGNEAMASGWGTESWAKEFAYDWGAESRQDDPEFVRWLAKLMRFSATPTAAIAFSRSFYGTDVRAVLPTIGVPTLLLHRANQGEREEIEYTAALIPGSHVEELRADDWNVWMADPEPMAHAIEDFVDGVRREDEALDRVLATVLFTDIVDSTAQSAALGDQAWREIREQHDSIVRAHLTRYRGTEVKTMGDGFLATFDGPARGVRCARAVADSVRPLGIEIRAGLHTGEVALEGADVSGIGVAIGARVGALAKPSEVLVSSTVKDLVAGSGLAFEDAGEHELKGVPDRWHLYHVVA